MNLRSTLLAVGTAALAAGGLTGVSAAQATSGNCEDNLGYRISSPAAYRETGWHTVVVVSAR